MALTSTDVINLALSEIGAAPIQNVNELSEQARRASILYPAIVRSEIRKHAWSCALTRTTLPAVAATPAYEYTYAYNLPTDFLRLWMINDAYTHPVIRVYTQEPGVPYTIEKKQILTNLAAPLKIRYVCDIQADPSQWDSALVEVVWLRLGMKLTPSLVRSDSKYKLMFEQYKDTLKLARRINAIELPPVPIADDSWVIGRL